MKVITLKEGEKIAADFTEKLTNILGSDLRMIASYGSIARGDFKAETSDINILVVSTRFDLKKLKEIAPILQKAKDSFRISAFFQTEDELRRMAELFPIKFDEIQKFYKVLQGEDLLKGSGIDWKFFKERARQEILNMQMKLRRTILLCSPNAALMARPLQEFIPHIMSLLRVLIERPESEQFDEDDRFLQYLAEKKTAIYKANYDEIEEIYNKLFENLDCVLKAIEKIP